MEIRFNYLLLPRMQSMLQRVHVREYILNEKKHIARANFTEKLLHITWEKLICETTQIHIKRLILYIHIQS